MELLHHKQRRPVQQKLQWQTHFQKKICYLKKE
jgi:hypothetical protein